jgi:hypothetical protein
MESEKIRGKMYRLIRYHEAAGRDHCRPCAFAGKFICTRPNPGEEHLTCKGLGWMSESQVDKIVQEQRKDPGYYYIEIDPLYLDLLTAEEAGDGEQEV